MVQQRLDLTFHALADPTRRGMLASLALGERSISQLAEPLDMSFAGASKHVKVLEDAGLVSRRVEWRTHFLALNPEPLRAAHEWLDLYRTFWESKLDALELFLASRKGRKKDGPRSPAKKKTRRDSR